MDALSTTPLLRPTIAAHDQGQPIVTIQPHHDAATTSPATLSAEPEIIDDSQRSLGFWDSVAMVLATQIGSGIFISPSLVARNAGSTALALLIWAVGGALAWACALCYVELGVRVPLNGGPQEYLAYCFNDLGGFLAAWGTIFALKPCSAAMLALFVSDYLGDIFHIDEQGQALSRQLIALLTIIVVTVINCIGNTQSRVLTKVLLGCKIFGLAFVLTMGLSTLIIPPQPSITPRALSVAPQPSLSNLTDATLQALWAYSGWETVSTHASINILQEGSHNIACFHRRRA